MLYFIYLLRGKLNICTSLSYILGDLFLILLVVCWLWNEFRQKACDFLGGVKIFYLVHFELSVFTGLR